MNATKPQSKTISTIDRKTPTYMKPLVYKMINVHCCIISGLYILINSHQVQKMWTE